MKSAREINVLLDGWVLSYEPQSAPALHLMTLLATRPVGVRNTVALPGSPPDWLPQDVEVELVPVANTPWGQLTWEQRILPAIARQTGADMLHLVTQTPPFSAPIPVVVSPADYTLRGQRSGLISRLRRALAAGGMSRLPALFWPSDLLPREGARMVYTLPPVVHPGFSSRDQIIIMTAFGESLPDAYVLYPAALGRLDFHRLLDVWSWVYSSLGDYYPLLLAGLSASESREAAELISRYGLEDSLRVVQVSNPLDTPALYQKSTAVFQLGDIPAWGNSARNALACGKPFVASASAHVDAIVGAAAYLAPAEDERALGAALITVIVEESMSEQLSLAAWQRSSDWDAVQFSSLLKEAYQAIISP